jgi:hypothetical protein
MKYRRHGALFGYAIASVIFTIIVLWLVAAINENEKEACERDNATIAALNHMLPPAKRAPLFSCDPAIRPWPFDN